ncbi:MAG TPA: DNA mismatch repair endonuclease MutL [Anaerolineae bacterium]|nr:DNA mismatch repair endonuclease MutL [Anaerolineae bacterium]
MPIQLLSEQLASQIAAGEVVERPASVVKELIENALDAGATTINLEIREGWRKLIQIADNGEGIPREQVALAFRRHATSKLVSAADLEAIGTLGFRGEALAAVAAVSQVTVVTRTAEAEAGSRLQLEGGKIVGEELVGAPQGTVLSIENLFFNVPARLKFLKTVMTEKRLIDEFVTRYALAYPQVRFRLAHDGRVTFETNGNGVVRDVLLAVYGLETARALLEVASEEAATVERPLGTKINGFVSPPSKHWSNRSHITLFVNGRWIKDQQLTYAVIQAYHTLLPKGRYPLAILFLEVAPKEVDVNVHPAKTEIRFRGKTPFGAIQRAVRAALIGDSPVRAVGSFASSVSGGWEGNLNQKAFGRREERGGGRGETDWGWFDEADEGGEGESPGPPPNWEGGEGSQGQLWAESKLATDPTGQGGAASQSGAASQTRREGERLPIMRVIGQVGASYIVTEGPDGLFLIDQHAAHERILYEQFLAQWGREEQIPVQGLVVGSAVHLPPAHATLIEEFRPSLARVGFELEPFGPNAFMIRGIPAIVSEHDPNQLLLDIVDDLGSGKVPMLSKVEDKLLRRVCKTAAVKAGQLLSMAEMDALIRQLEGCENPHTCPHGRPTLIYLSVAQLAHEFGRV